MASKPDRVANIADAIERYLRAHPDAADSVEGIRLWWLTGDGAEESPECVGAALERLEAAGIVDRRTLPGGQVVYAGVRQS